ncbi:hypothetical protein [Clostridium sp.]|uniref:hypothetical protein n=1 Tax=Clostridium sp. TaxID=1506 RepID=UPI0035A184E9
MEKGIINILLFVLSAALQAIAVAMMKTSNENSKKIFVRIVEGWNLYCQLTAAKGLSELSLNVAQPIFIATMFISMAVLSIIV